MLNVLYMCVNFYIYFVLQIWQLQTSRLGHVHRARLVITICYGMNIFT